VPRLCENYLQKTKVVNVSLILTRFGLKVENHTQYLHIYLLYVGYNLKPVPIFRVFTQPVPKADVKHSFEASQDVQNIWENCKLAKVMSENNSFVTWTNYSLKSIL